MGQNVDSGQEMDKNWGPDIDNQHPEFEVNSVESWHNEEDGHTLGLSACDYTLKKCLQNPNCHLSA